MRLAIALCLLALPVRAGIIDKLPGTWGSTLSREDSCPVNPTTIAITGSRITFTTPEPGLSYTGAMITTFGGTILHHDDTELVMQRDAETRRDRRGRLLLWTMRLDPANGGYCWQNSDEGRSCVAEWFRCGGNLALTFPDS